jgi:diketogulonate reductase-like aldo/keto reductase
VCNQRKDVEGALKESCKILQLNYVDLYLAQWPAAYDTDKEGKELLIKIPNYNTWAKWRYWQNQGLQKASEHRILIFRNQWIWRFIEK